MRVLVVGRDVRTARLLEQGGHVAVLMPNAEEALRAAGPCDAVVVDSTVAPQVAHELCRSLRMRRDLAVMLLTDQGDPQARIEALEAGADDCLSVPFLVGELHARLRAIVRRSSVDLSASEVHEGPTTC